MRYLVKLILDIPYSSFRQGTVRIEADDIDSLITEAIPRRACKELAVLQDTVWKEIGWKHVNMKFSFHGIDLEIVFDQEKRNLATVYFCSGATGEVLSHSSSPLTFTGETDEESLAEEIAKRAAEAKVLSDNKG